MLGVRDHDVTMQALARMCGTHLDLAEHP
jgi:hypothetical protein